MKIRFHLSITLTALALLAHPLMAVVKSSGAPQQQSQAAASQSAPAQAPDAAKQQAPKYTSEQLEEIKKQKEKAQAMNALILQVNEAVSAKKWQDAIGPLQQLVAMDPANWQFYEGLGHAELNLGQYDQAVESFQKGIDLAGNISASDPPSPNSTPEKIKLGLAAMLTNQGNAYLKLHKNDQAIAAYTRAAALDPNPATAYFNICATQYNAGNIEGALQACDKALAIDPGKADAYFIKGSLLLGESKTDKSGKLLAPPGTAQALEKYLELAPNGTHVKDVQEMLSAIGVKVETTYKSRQP